MALLPLRLFLGVTFTYAGVQKLSDPGFLQPGAPTYIGTQLKGFAHGTPGGFLLRAFAIPNPKLAGIAVALLEIAVGLLVTSGLLTRIAAGVGLGLSAVLFLTASWKTSPYFLGSDIVFAFAWLPFALAGAAGQPAVDHALGRWAERGPPWRRARAGLAARWEEDVARAGGRATPRGSRPPAVADPPLTRRAVLAQALGLAGVGAVAIGGIAALMSGSYRVPTRRLVAGRANRPPAQATRPTPASHRKSAERSVLPSGAVPIGTSSQVVAGQGATYTDPSTGESDIVIREAGNGLKAFSAVCTHAGCTVGYQGGQIICPCHGATYDPQTGAVTGGPAPQGLTPRKVMESGGKIYALPS